MNELVKLSLKEEEEIIAKGFSTFIEVGNALFRIRSEKKFLPEFSTFKQYMDVRWGWTSSQGRKQITGAQIGQHLSEKRDDRPAPSNEWQVRPLSRLRQDEELDYPRISDAWQEACYLAETDNRECPTYKDVKYVVDEMLYAPPPPLPEGKFHILYVDPPWQYDFSVSPTRTIERQYPTMTVKQICKMRPDIDKIAAADCVLFLWATNPKLREALLVIKKWGFDYKTGMVWVKDKWGMGYYARQQHELLLIGARGNLPQPDTSCRPSSVIEAPRTEHSRKPKGAYSIIETMYPDCKKVELFARNERAGWESWGNDST